MPLPKGTPTELESAERLRRSKARAKAKQVFGEEALIGMEVHHKNGNNEDNRPSNLALIPKCEHAKHHGRGHGKKGSKNIRNNTMDNESIFSTWSDGLQLATNEAEPKEDIMLFPFGEFEHPSYGKMVFDTEFFNDIIMNYQNNVLHVKPFMDKQHDEDKALAWFDTSPFIRPGLGLYIKPDYTELGQAVLSKRTYRYFSPSFGKYKDPETGTEFKNVLMGGAATNIPFLKTMPSIIDETAVLDNKGMVEYKLNDLITGSLETEGIKADESGKQKPIKLNKDKQMKEINKIFNLSDEATADETVKAVEDLKAENESLKKEIETLKANKAETPEPVEAEKALTDELKDTKKQLNDMQVQLTIKDRDEAIKVALSEGKIMPVDKEYWEKRFMSDPKNVGQDLIKMSVSVDLGETGKAGEGEKVELNDNPGQKLVDEAKKLMAEDNSLNFDSAYVKVCGAKPELFKAYQKAFNA